MRQTLKDARNERGYTQRQVAGMIGCSLRMYQHMETGDREGRYEWWEQLEPILGIPQGELRKNDGTPQRQLRGPSDHVKTSS